MDDSTELKDLSHPLTSNHQSYQGADGNSRDTQDKTKHDIFQRDKDRDTIGHASFSQRDSSLAHQSRNDLNATETSNVSSDLIFSQIEDQEKEEQEFKEYKKTLLNPSVQFLGLKLCPDVKPVNLLVFLYMWFMCNAQLTAALGPMSFALKSTDSYNYSPSEYNEMFGKVGIGVEILMILVKLGMGPLFDVVGRRKPLFIGQILCTCGFFLVPTELFGWRLDHNLIQFIIARILIQTGGMSAINAPLLPDYVERESLATCSGYMLILGNLGTMTGIGIPLLQNLSFKGTYYSLGGLSALSALVILVGLKDVVVEDIQIRLSSRTASIASKAQTEQSNKVKSMGLMIKGLVDEFKNDAHFYYAIFACGTVKLMIVALVGYTGGYLSRTAEYMFLHNLQRGDNGKLFPSSQVASETANQRYTVLSVTANFVSMFFGMGAGKLMDLPVGNPFKFKLHRGIITLYFLAFIGFSMILFGIYKDEERDVFTEDNILKTVYTRLSLWFESGYVFASILAPIGFLFGNTMLAKTVNPKNRGTWFGMNSIYTSFNIITIAIVGGNTSNPTAVYYAAMIGITFGIISFLALTFMKKVHL